MFAAKHFSAVTHALVVSFAAFFFCLVVARFFQFKPNMVYDVVLSMATFIIYFPASKNFVANITQRINGFGLIVISTVIFFLFHCFNTHYVTSLLFILPLLIIYLYLHSNHNFYIKKIWWAKPIAIATAWNISCMVVPYLFAGFHFSHSFLFLLLHMMLLTFSLSLAYDIVDREKDNQLHYQTFATKLGIKQTTHISLTLLSISALIALVTFYHKPYFALSTSCNAAMVIFVYAVLKIPVRMYALLDLIFTLYFISLFFSM